MNILPKKSWHVRNKDNVARVRRDEALAEEEESERKRRVDLAEQEARTDYLRKKARRSLPDCTTGSNVVALLDPKEGHGRFNIFEDLVASQASKQGNKEYEEEKRLEKERQEKAVGLLVYLGQSAAEAQTSRPWYQEVPANHHKEADVATKDEKLKGRLDPLHEMEKYLRKKRKEKGKKESMKSEKKRERGVEDKKQAGPRQPSIEQLRQERLKREKSERLRASALMAGSAVDKREISVELDDRKRSYNSQFNPGLVRKPKILKEYR